MLRSWPFLKWTKTNISTRQLPMGADHCPWVGFTGMYAISIGPTAAAGVSVTYGRKARKYIRIFKGTSFYSPREICRTCPAEGSDIAGHFVRQGSIHRKCPARETRIAGHQLRKMSGKGSKCPAEHWRPAGRPEIIFARTVSISLISPVNINTSIDFSIL